MATTAVVIVGAVPLVVALPAPLVDWPNHLARVFVGTRLWRGDAHWATFYTLNPRPVPNEALDLGVGALTLAGVPLDLAGSAFLVFAYLAFVVGLCRLARAMGALDASKPMLASLLFLTGPLMYGLVNYMLGLGLAFCLAGVAIDGSQRARWTVALAGTVALFYVHLLACVVLVLVLGCADIARLARGRTGLRNAGASVAACVTLVAMLALSDAATDSMPRVDASNVFYPGGHSVLATLTWKAGMFVRLLTDHASRAGAGLAVCGVLAFAVLARPVRIGVIGWLVLAAALGLVLILPEAAGTGSLLDYRLALVPLAIAAAGARWPAGGLHRAAFAVLCLVAIGRSADFAYAFARQGAAYAAFDRAAARLPPATMLLVARGRTDAEIGPFAWWSPPAEHLGTRAVLAGVFVPTVFAVASQQPVVLRPEFAAWRHEWRTASDPELAALLHDIAPVCAAVADGSAPGGLRNLALLEVYPGPTLRDVFAPADVLAENPAFRLVEPCGARYRPS